MDSKYLDQFGGDYLHFRNLSFNGKGPDGEWYTSDDSVFRISTRITQYVDCEKTITEMKILCGD